MQIRYIDFPDRRRVRYVAELRMVRGLHAVASGDITRRGEVVDSKCFADNSESEFALAITSQSN